MPRTAWAAPGRSWFKLGGRAEGPVVALHPGSRTHFFHALESFRAEDYEMTYDVAAGGGGGGEGAPGRQNRFAYLGNGFSTRELEEGADMTWYLDEPATV